MDTPVLTSRPARGDMPGMKPRQLTLLQAPTLPSRPFTRYTRAISELLVCSACGRDIVAQRRRRDGAGVSEFVSDAGECFECDRTGKR
jgi:hypothetical protein